MDHENPVTTDTIVVGAVADSDLNTSQTPNETEPDKNSSETSQDADADAKASSAKEPTKQPIIEKHASRIDALQAEDLEARKGAQTPDIANVAAEVADSAALLDQGQPTPPISDEEAGRIGYRRMSNTPIPEVAMTAAEVADVAAKLEESTIVNHHLHAEFLYSRTLLGSLLTVCRMRSNLHQPLRTI
jgi:hypothetical protein